MNGKIAITVVGFCSGLIYVGGNPLLALLAVVAGVLVVLYADGL